MSTAFRSYVTLSIMLSLYGKQINVAEDTLSEDSSSCGCASLNRGNSKILAEDYVPPLETLPSPVKAEMVFIPGGTFLMGTTLPLITGDGEGPQRPVTISPFFIDTYEVDNEHFGQFVSTTGYVTDSERYGWSFVFHSAVSKSVERNVTQSVLGFEWWWQVWGADWLHPEGPDSNVFSSGRHKHPAVHVSWNDAKVFCSWRDARLPTEAEWEYAARGGETGKMFPWGNKLHPKGKHRANIWQGNFPVENTADDGFVFLAPVDALGPQNKFGLYQMIGNAWEWVEDWWTDKHSTEEQHDPRGPEIGEEKVKRGGSFLCHKSHCYRYRNAARTKTSADSATLNNGFRCARDASEEEIAHQISVYESVLEGEEGEDDEVEST